MKRSWLVMGAMVLAGAGAARAHLDASGLKPATGETINVGSTYAITWKVSVKHSKGTSIDLSRDGGKTWTILKDNYEGGSGTNTYNWPVTGEPTNTARIRICQHGEGTPVKACSATDTVNFPSTTPNGNYVILTKAFTISGPSAVHSVSGASADFSIGFRPETRNVEVAFALAAEQDVSLQAFDAQGHLVATLLEGKQGAGSHRLSVYSNRLDGVAGIFVFKMNAGGEVRTRSVNVTR